MTTWDDRASTDATRRCLQELRDASGENDVFEHHGMRVALLCEAMAARRGLTLDTEVLDCAALLHDIGLYDGPSRGGVYVTDGALFAREVLAPFGWSEERLALCAEAIERHHEVRPQWSRGAEVELLRRADLIDLSGGLVRSGLPRAEVQTIMRAAPRNGAYRHIGALLGRALLQRPLTVPRIFVRG